jgi:hypothetical protein
MDHVSIIPGAKHAMHAKVLAKTNPFPAQPSMVECRPLPDGQTELAMLELLYDDAHGTHCWRLQVWTPGQTQALETNVPVGLSENAFSEFFALAYAEGTWRAVSVGVDDADAGHVNFNNHCLIDTPLQGECHIPRHGPRLDVSSALACTCAAATILRRGSEPGCDTTWQASTSVMWCGAGSGRCVVWAALQDDAGSVDLDTNWIHTYIVCTWSGHAWCQERVVVNGRPSPHTIGGATVCVDGSRLLVMMGDELQSSVMDTTADIACDIGAACVSCPACSAAVAHRVQNPSTETTEQVVGLCQCDCPWHHIFPCSWHQGGWILYQRCPSTSAWVHSEVDESGFVWAKDGEPPRRLPGSAEHDGRESAVVHGWGVLWFKDTSADPFVQEVSMVPFG